MHKTWWALTFLRKQNWYTGRWYKRCTSASYQKIVIICWRTEPRKSSLIRCSRTQTTTPTIRKYDPVTHHISKLNGCKNAQDDVICSLTGAKITKPVSMNGWVKSIATVRLIVIAISPIAASNSWRIRCPWSVQYDKWLGEEKWCSYLHLIQPSVWVCHN